MNLIMAIMFSMQVLSWGTEVEYIEEIEPYEMMAIIHVESTGCDEARRPGSRYHGLLQISNDYMEDALVYAGQPVEPASTLIGDGPRSIQIFYWYMQRYSFLHNWNVERIAVLHKTGPVAFQEILDRMEGNTSFGDAVCVDESDSACVYLRRFRTYRSTYRSEWAEPVAEG